MAYGPNIGMIDEETPEQRRMRLLAQVSPFMPRGASSEMASISSDSPYGMATPGFSQETYNTPERGTWVDPGTTADPGPAWRDPGSTGAPNPYQDVGTPKLGDFFATRPIGSLDTKPGEPGRAEMDGILFNGTRSAPGLDVLRKGTSGAPEQAGPDVAAAGMNVRGANNTNRANVPRSPDAPEAYTSASSPPALRGGFADPAESSPASVPTPNRQPRAIVQGGATPAPERAPGAPAAAASAASQPAAGAAAPQFAALAQGLSHPPGSQASTNWLSQNSDLLIGIGAGLLSGGSIGEGILKGLDYANKSKAVNAKQRELDRKYQMDALKTAQYAAMAKQVYGDKISNDQALAIAQNDTMMNEVFKQMQPPEWTQIPAQGDKAGYLKSRSGDIKADPSQPAEGAIMTPAERAEAQIPPDDNRPYWRKPGEKPEPIGGQKMVRSPADEAQIERDKKRIEMITEDIKGTLKGASAARNLERSVDAMGDLLATTDTGGKTAVMNKIREATGGLVTLDPNADKVQAFQSMAQQIASGLYVPGKGSQSDTEYKGFQSQIPQLYNSKGGAQIILETLRGLAKARVAETELAQEYAGGRIKTEEEYYRRIQELPDPMEGYRKALSKYGVQPPEAAAASPPEASAEQPKANAPPLVWDPKKRAWQ